jgi:hypothetical protein
VGFRGIVRQQIYSGASELLEIDCGGGQILRARIPASGPLTGEREFVFCASDAVVVTESAAAQKSLAGGHGSH